MKWLQHLLNYFKLRDQLGLSRKDIKRVRDNIIALYLAPGEYAKVPAPDGFFPVSEVEIGCSSSIPYFKWDSAGVTYVAWLKVPRENKPCWDLLIGVSADQNPDIEGIAPALPFTNPRVKLAAHLVKYFASYFPILPTNNYVQNKGAVIA